MKGIRRFQRAMITLLVGVNILVFSTSLYGDIRAALGQSIVAMAIVGSISVALGFIASNQKNKKPSQMTSPSKKN